MKNPFVPIPAGSFLMGSEDGQEDERPVHRVWVDAFELAAHPITARQYAAFLRETGHDVPRGWHAAAAKDDPRAAPCSWAMPPEDGERPVVGVSWFDAQAYCAWRTRNGDPVRLPTEAEWERAARGGHEGWRYPWGDAIPDWIPNGGRGSLEGPWPVTLGCPNAFGVYGIAANIHEWCADWYDAAFYRNSPDRNPTGPATGTRKASRGGSWRHAITISRSAARSRIDPSFRYTDYGFRVARST
jgi:formylglycine-generating enzyme required for sulfatase activity